MINSLIKRIAKQGKLKLVEKSIEISKSYMIKSDNCFKSAKVLYEEKLYENSIASSYYAMYNAVQSLLFQCGIKCENHTASIELLQISFNLNTLQNIVSHAKKERIDKQYYVIGDLEEITAPVAKEMIQDAEEVRTHIRSVLNNLQIHSIEKAREKVKDIIS